MAMAPCGPVPVTDNSVLVADTCAVRRGDTG
jgi:hypothetical protein